MWFWKNKPLTSAERWGLAAGGVLTLLNGESFDRLRCKIGKRRSRKLLADDWGVKNAEETMKMLQKLENGLHSKSCAEACLSMRLHYWNYAENKVYTSFVKSHLDELEAHQIIGWDLSRIINVARWGYTAGFVNQDLAWQAIMQAAAGIQAAYRSWEEFGEDFCLGLEYWQAARGEPLDFDIGVYLEWLLATPQSPWQVPFKTPL